ncbi:hypothetical protein SASPL_152857 [Salvia splendens]|uniref:Uncharacterized protein n=1 Tax=Salvia splendens TaxID=180675 RepID=A0A8X8W404_SALSN|nr:uncharacterized protein LOC121783640 isoform X2 [Salvia splendens]KAG6387665.1 hypothetical protein SASPL_152857 [Salvia splendens]
MAAALASSSLHLSAARQLLKSSAFAYPKKQNLKVGVRVRAASKGKDDSSVEDPSIPQWAQPGSEEPPPWAREEAQKESSGVEVPFYAYLIASSITAIAAIGSIFEYVNEKPVFGVLSSDSVLYAPVLGFFVFTGIPTSAFLWYKSVEAANKEAEEQDRRDGFL